MTVVCGIDFSAASRDTAEVAAALAAVLGEDLVLVHALGDPAYFLDAAVRRDHRELALRRLEGLGAELTPPDARRRVRAEVLEGGAHRGLVSFAREGSASLLVVGAHGHGGSAAMGLGSIAERCALRSLVPVLAARDAAPFLSWAAGRRALRAVVCVDPFGGMPAAGLSWIRRLRAAAPCDVTAACAYHPDELQQRRSGPPPSLVEPDPRLERELIERLRASIGELPGMGDFAIAVTLALTRPAEPLVELAIRGGAQLMVVGTHHAHGPPRPWSVSAGVIHLAPISVAAVPVPPGS